MLCRCQVLSVAILLVAHTKILERMGGILTKERFLLFSQRCISRKVADLLHFMLHNVLSVTIVEFLCCHNAILYVLRDEMTWGSCQLFIWRLNLWKALSFNSSLQKKFVLTLPEDIIIQSEPEKQDKNQITEKKFQNSWEFFEIKFSNASYFETKFSQCIRFWFKNFTTRQILAFKKTTR